MSQPGESVVNYQGWRQRWGVARFRAAIAGAAAVAVCALLLAAPAVARADDGYSHDSDSHGVVRTAWMGTLSDTLRLSELTIPGTHDSGSYVSGGDSIETQSMDLNTQLAAGIRAFDIRLGWIPGLGCPGPSLWVVHSNVGCEGQTFTTVLNTMNTFLAAHPSEAIVMRVRNDTIQNTGSPDDATFEQTVTSDLAPYSRIWPVSTNDPTLGQIRGKIVVLQDWTGNTLGIPWSFPNKQDDFSLPTEQWLADKWDNWSNLGSNPVKSAKPQFTNANSGPVGTTYINFLSAATGAFPYFFASGKSSSGTNDPALLTGWTRGTIDTCASTYQCISDYPNVNCALGTCSVAYRGMNQLAENAINANTGWKKLGIVFADYPGPGSASTPGLIGSLIAVNQRYSTPKLSQTITFNPNPLPNRTVGDPPFTVAPTSTSTLPVSVTSSTTAVCTVASNSVTIVAAGTCTLNANQAGDSRYLAATQVTRPFTVSKKAQTITFSQVAMQTYGSTWPTVTPSSTSGLFVTVAATTPTCAAVTLDVNNPQTYTIELLGAGTCTLTANQAGNATYLAAPQAQQSFTINKANQTITFNAIPNEKLGVAPFGVSPTATSGLPVTVSSNTTGICTVSANTVTVAAPGTCSLTANQTGNGNYNPATPVTQTFGVTSKNQIKDGGFESPLSTGNTTRLAGQKIGPWNVTAGSIDIAGLYWQNGAGNQSLDMAGLQPGTITQTVTLPWTASYTLKFKYAGNPEGGPTTKHLLVTANAPGWLNPVSASKTFDITGHTTLAMGWKSGKLTFTATAGDVVTITFQDNSGTAFGSTLDAVSLIGG